MAINIARLGVLLGLDSAEFVKGIDAAQKKLGQLMDAVTKYGPAAALAFSAAAGKAISLADEIADVAKANDTTIDSVIKLSEALMVSGGKAEDAGKLLSSFTNFIDKAAGGSLEAQKSFQRFGVSLNDLARMDGQTLFQKTVEGLAAIEDPVTRNARAMDAFGKAAKGVDFANLATEIENAKGKSGDQARAIDAAAGAFDDLAKAARKAGLSLATEVGPQLKVITEQLLDLKSPVGVIGAIFTRIFSDIVIGGAGVVLILRVISAAVVAVAESGAAIASGKILDVARIRDQLKADANQMLDDTNDFVKRIAFAREGGAGGGRGFVNPTDRQPPPPRREVTAAEDTKRLQAIKESQKKADEIAAASARNRFALERQTADEIAAVQIDLAEKVEAAKRKLASDNVNEQGKFAKENARIYAEAVVGAAQEASDKISKINNRRYLEEVAASRDRQQEYDDAAASAERADVDARDAALRSIQSENDGLELQKAKYKLGQDMMFSTQKELRLAQLRLDTEAEILQIQRMRESGGYSQETADYLIRKRREQGGIKASIIEMEEAGKTIGEMWSSVTDKMTSAIETFVRTGKLSFADLAKSIVADLIRIELRASANSLFAGFKNAVMGSFGPAPTYGGVAPSGGYYADGGDPPVGVPSMVGERGPELFVPRTAGTVIPNHALSGLGGTTNVTNNYIQAIDAKSFEDRLLGSSKAIWAANAYAAKGYNTSGGRA